MSYSSRKLQFLDPVLLNFCSTQPIWCWTPSKLSLRRLGEDASRACSFFYIKTATHIILEVFLLLSFYKFHQGVLQLKPPCISCLFNSVQPIQARNACLNPLYLLMIFSSLISSTCLLNFKTLRPTSTLIFFTSRVSSIFFSLYSTHPRHSTHTPLTVHSHNTELVSFPLALTPKPWSIRHPLHV